MMNLGRIREKLNEGAMLAVLIPVGIVWNVCAGIKNIATGKPWGHYKRKGMDDE